MTPEHNRLIDKYEALVAENASLKTAIKMHQNAEKIAAAELTKLNLQIGEINKILLGAISDTAKVIRIEGVLAKTEKRFRVQTPMCGSCGSMDITTLEKSAGE